MKRLLLLPLVLATASTAKATIYADLLAGTVTGRNDGLADVVITDGIETVKTSAEKAKSPPGTQKMEAHEKLTVPMNRAGFKYYKQEFVRLKRQGDEALRSKAEQEKNIRDSEEDQIKKDIKLRRVFRSLLGEQRNCVSNSFGSTTYTNCY